MSTESVIWWSRGHERGVVVESTSFADEGTIDSVSGAMPADATELTEPEFAQLLRQDHLNQFYSWQGQRALKVAAIAQAQADRQARVDELVALGLSTESAEAIVPPAPVIDLPEQYPVPEGTAEHLRSTYRLSDESISLILAPIEE